MKPRKSTTPPPSPHVAAILLSGWCATPLAEGTPHGFSGGFLQLATDVGLVALWQEHEPYLRKEAERCGIAASWQIDDGAPLFYGEFVMRTLAAESAGGTL